MRERGQNKKTSRQDTARTETEDMLGRRRRSNVIHLCMCECNMKIYAYVCVFVCETVDLHNNEEHTITKCIVGKNCFFDSVLYSTDTI